jgi:diguanylate cyclase (GGDEF)-like protein/PAS domain S-box-containing protein
MELPRRRIPRGLVAVALPAILLIALAWAAAVLLMRHEYEGAVASAYRDNANLALAFEQHSLSAIRAVDQVLSLVVVSRETGVSDAEFVARARKVNPDLAFSVLVADASGKVVAGGETLEALDLSDREFFASHRDHDSELLVGKPVQGRHSGRIIIPITRRVSNPDGSFGGVVVAGVDPMYFVDYYGKMELGHSGLVQMLGLDGRLRVRRTGSYIAAPEDVVSGTLLRMQAKSDTGNYLSGGKREGNPRHTSYRTLREYGLVVAVGTAEEDVLEPYRIRRNALLATAALFSLAVLVVAAMAFAAMRRRQRFLVETMHSEAQLLATFQQAAVGIAHMALDGRFLKVNEALCRMLGYSRQELLERRVYDLKPLAERSTAEQAVNAIVASGSTLPLEGIYLRKDGSGLWASVAPAVVRDPEGKPEYLVAMVQDIGERKIAQDKLLRQAQFDTLTDLPNRSLFADRLGEALVEARRRQWSAAVMFIDLDGFKAVNDTFGHAAGDALLREVAQRIEATLRTGDTGARVGGDEFAAVLAHLAHPADAALVAAKIIRVIGAPLAIDGREHVVTASIGIALFPDHGVDEEELVRHADAAMFDAKQAGKNRFRVYETPRTPLAA